MGTGERDSRQEQGIEFLTRAVRTTNPYEETLRRLLQSIRLGLSAPGQRLTSERDLASMLGISRDTVRETISTLAEAGYLVSKRGRYGGTFVVEVLPADTDRAGERRVTAQQLNEISMLRRVIEVGVVRELAMRTLTASERASLRVALDDCLGSDASTFRRHDSRLHLLFTELAGSPGLVQLSVDLRTRLNDALDAMPMMPPNRSHSNAQHSEIVGAVLECRPEVAARHARACRGN